MMNRVTLQQYLVLDPKAGRVHQTQADARRARRWGQRKHAKDSGFAKLNNLLTQNWFNFIYFAERI